MSVTGVEEMLANVSKLEMQAPRKARQAITKGAEEFEQTLKVNTPVDYGELANSTAITGFKGGNQGLLEKDVGFTKDGYYGRFPDDGTIYQKSQHFVEKTQNQVTPKIQEIYVDTMREVFEV